MIAPRIVIRMQKVRDSLSFDCAFIFCERSHCYGS